MVQPSKQKRVLFIALGWISLAAAFVGVLLPVIPQVPFAVIAAYFFSKGSPRLHHWLLNNNKFGASLRDWEMDRVVRTRTKVFATAMMVGGAGIAWWRYHADDPVKAYVIDGIFVVAIAFVLTRRSKSRAECPEAVRREAFRIPPSSAT